MERLRPFEALTPDAVLAAAESLGIECDARLFALNSYENRVYQLGSTSHGLLVLKFYRPARWSDAQILEEHEFTAELLAVDLPVAAPLVSEGRTLRLHDGLRFSVFPKMAARAADINARGSLELIGRTLGRLHAVGALRKFSHRPALTSERLGWDARDALLDSDFIVDMIDAGTLDAGLVDKYAEVSAILLERVDETFLKYGPMRLIRLHGDCHLGNVLWDERGPVFVDLDDCMSGPCIQDLWMLLSGSLDERRGQWKELVTGYREFHPLDSVELALIEPLRALRMVHHSAWIAARWKDPAFPRAFPWFTSSRFWQEHVNDLWQQVDALKSGEWMGIEEGS
ncbi:MAG: serine/threonine protein kinase [Gammaproteobacteria bacterium]|nr:serine/threonine protein kinase [Gammaproteobacteria bacterium]